MGTDIRYVYGLVDPVTMDVRYVGVTKDLKDRLKDHLRKSRLRKKDNARTKWLLGLLEKGLKPLAIILETTTALEGYDREKYWVAFYGRKNLVNETDGGKGVDGNKESEETKRLKSKIAIDNFNKLTEEERQIRASKQAGIKRPTTSSKASRFVGINFHIRHQKYNSRIQYKNVRYELGLYDTEEEAAKAYNEAALKFYGPNAKLNIID